MRNKILLERNPIDVIGKVEISYTDPVTGRIREQIKGENHAFKEVFQGGNWYALLNNTTDIHMCLMDDDTPPVDTFPYLRGGVIGWGMSGASVSGNRGMYNAGESFNAQQTVTGLRWKWVYDFIGTQAVDPVKSVGLTAQYGRAYNPPIRRINYITNNLNYVYASPGQWGYRCTNSVVGRYNPITNTVETVVTLTSVLESISNVTNQCLFYEIDTGDWLLYCYNSTIASRRVYRFSSDFTTLRNTYAANDLALNGVFVGAAYNGNIFHSTTAGTLTRYTVATNTLTASFLTFPAQQILSFVANTSARTGCLVKPNGIVYYHSNLNSVGTLNPIIDIINGEFVSCFGNGDSSDSAGHFIEHPFEPLRTVMVSSVNQTQFQYRTALTCFIVPPNQPVRPSGDGMRVAYTLDVNY